MKKVAVVTGASKGIGKALAEILHAEQYTVVNASREGKDDGVSIFIITDVTNQKDCREMAEKVISKYGRIDLLVNNAGVLHPDSIDNVDKAKAGLETNVLSHFYVTNAVVEQMKKQGSGQIVNISSSAGMSFKEGLLSYSTTKWAIVGFSGALRIELQKFGIDVVCFCPGGTKTDLYRHFSSDPSGEYMDPKEVAQQILKSMIRGDKNEWLFNYNRKDRILRSFGFHNYPGSGF